MRKHLLILLILPLFILSCGSDEAEDDLLDPTDGGTYNLTLSGELNVTSAGEATFIHGKYDDYQGLGSGSVLAVNFINEEEDFLVTCSIQILGDASGIKPGSYPVAIEAEAGDPAVVLGTFTATGALLGTSGAITISDVKNFTVEGSIDAIMGNGVDNSEDTTIKGSFTAKGVTETL